MFDNESTESLRSRLAGCNETIRKLRSYGHAAMLDCRQMQIAQHNSSFISAELAKRAEAAKKEQ